MRFERVGGWIGCQRGEGLVGGGARGSEVDSAEEPALGVGVGLGCSDRMGERQGVGLIARWIDLLYFNSTEPTGLMRPRGGVCETEVGRGGWSDGIGSMSRVMGHSSPQIARELCSRTHPSTSVHTPMAAPGCHSPGRGCGSGPGGAAPPAPAGHPAAARSPAPRSSAPGSAAPHSG